MLCHCRPCAFLGSRLPMYKTKDYNCIGRRHRPSRTRPFAGPLFKPAAEQGHLQTSQCRYPSVLAARGGKRSCDSSRSHHHPPPASSRLIILLPATPSFYSYYAILPLPLLKRQRAVVLRRSVSTQSHHLTPNVSTHPLASYQITGRKELTIGKMVAKTLISSDLGVG
jgi:hypothetical protein